MSEKGLQLRVLVDGHAVDLLRPFFIPGIVPTALVADKERAAGAVHHSRLRPASVSLSQSRCLRTAAFLINMIIRMAFCFCGLAIPL